MAVTKSRRMWSWEVRIVLPLNKEPLDPQLALNWMYSPVGLWCLYLREAGHKDPNNTQNALILFRLPLDISDSTPLMELKGMSGRQHLHDIYQVN